MCPACECNWTATLIHRVRAELHSRLVSSTADGFGGIKQVFVILLLIGIVEMGHPSVQAWNDAKPRAVIAPEKPRVHFSRRLTFEPYAVLRERLCAYYHSGPNDLHSNEVC